MKFDELANSIIQESLYLTEMAASFPTPRQFSPEEDKKMVQMYNSPNYMSTRDIGKELGVSKYLIGRRLQELGVEMRPSGYDKKVIFSPEDDKKMVRMYEVDKLSLAEIGGEFGVSFSLVRKRLLELGIKLRPPGAEKVIFSPEDDKKMVRMYKVDKLIPREIGREFGVGENTVRKRLLELGVKLRVNPRHSFSPEDDKKMVRMYEVDKLTQDEIAGEFDVDKNTIKRRLLKLGVKLRPRSYQYTKVKADNARKYMSTRNISGKGTANTQYFSGMDDTGTQRPIPKRLGGNQP